MTASDQNRSPDFFEERGLDPVTTATHYPPGDKPTPKKKAGFYLSKNLLDRFNRCFHKMKLAGTPIENKSALLEIALLFALKDLEMGDQSLILQRLENGSSDGTECSTKP